uniref:WD_REPEATS_REGION domain-containing protein n=1 Tax=Macrostomum lignano TaxID=282301 RepID=A0A1I8I9Q9_9PLAT
MQESLEAINLQIRKYSKKLRQIERLVCSPRALNEEEQSKVSKKTALQASLLHYMQLLKRHQPSSSSSSPQSGNDQPLSEASALPAAVTATAERSEAISDSQQPPAKRVAVGCSNLPEESLSSQSDQLSIESLQGSAAQSIEGTTATSQPISTIGRKATATSQPISAIGRKATAISQPISAIGRKATAISQPISAAVEKQQKSTSQSAPSVQKPQKSTSQSAQSAPKPHSLASYSVSQLSNGHSDIIFSTDSSKNLAVTAGRDTSVQVYEIEISKSGLSCQGSSRLTGHAQAVNVARLVDCSDCPALSEALGAASTILCVTGSEDATVRIWECESGRQLFEHYVFASVTALQALKSSGTLLLLTGSSSGKLELWDPAGLWDRGPCLMADQLFNGRVTDLQVYDGERGWAALAGSRGQLLAACSSAGELALGRLNDPAEASAGRCCLARPLLCFLPAVAAASPASGPRLRLRQPSALQLLPSASSGSMTAVLGVADRHCSGVKCVSLRTDEASGSGSPVTAISRLPGAAAGSAATSICDCLLLLPNALLAVAAFDYLAGASFLQVFDAESLASLGKTDSNHSGLSIGRILCLAAINSGNSGPGDSAFTLISGGDRALLWTFSYAACHKSSGRLALIADPVRRGPAASYASSTSACSSSSDLDTAASADSDDCSDDAEDSGSHELQPSESLPSGQRSWCSIA